MKKNLLLRLCLIMSVVLTLSSCTNEDFYSSVENPKQEIISKSLWKEDALFTQRIYDHFLQSFMSTEANQQKFVSEHGNPAWEYTMTMGFKREQLYVPLIQNNQVIGVMRVQRQDKKVFYSFTQNSEALAFFDIVMYNRNLDKLQPQKDEKLNENISSKGGGATWTCTKRTVISGYHMEGDVMVMETSTMNVCKYSYTGVKPYVDHLDFDTDGIEGGGGDGNEEEEEEQNEENPCDKAKDILASPEVQANITSLKEQSKIKGDNSRENGFNVNLDGTTSGIITGEKHSVDLGATTGKQGGYHNHTPDGIKMHSPPDILKLLSYAIGQPDGDFSNAFFGMFGSEECSTCPGGYKYNHYIIRFNGTSQELVKYVYQTNWDKTALGRTYRETVYQLFKNTNYIESKGKLNSNGLQKLFFDTLKNMGMEGKVNLQRIDEDENGAVTIQKITQDSNGSTITTPCP